jgi:hypothetical protein
MYNYVCNIIHNWELYFVTVNKLDIRHATKLWQLVTFGNGSCVPSKLNEYNQQALDSNSKPHGGKI